MSATEELCWGQLLYNKRERQFNYYNALNYNHVLNVFLATTLSCCQTLVSLTGFHWRVTESHLHTTTPHCHP